LLHFETSFLTSALELVETLVWVILVTFGIRR